MKLFMGLLLILMAFLTACAITPTGGIVADPNDECSGFEGAAKDNCYFEVKKCTFWE